MADLERFDGDPDLNFNADADQDQNFLVRERKKIFPQNLHNYFFKNLTKLVMCNFLSSNAEGGVRDKG